MEVTVEEPSDVKNASKETYVLGDSVGALDNLEDLATPDLQIIEEEKMEMVVEEVIETQEVIVQEEEIAEIITEMVLVDGGATAQSAAEAEGKEGNEQDKT